MRFIVDNHVVMNKFILSTFLVGLVGGVFSDTTNEVSMERAGRSQSISGMVILVIFLIFCSWFAVRWFRRTGKERDRAFIDSQIADISSAIVDVLGIARSAVNAKVRNLINNKEEDPLLGSVLGIEMDIEEDSSGGYIRRIHVYIRDKEKVVVKTVKRNMPWEHFPDQIRSEFIHGRSKQHFKVIEIKQPEVIGESLGEQQ